MLHELVHTWVSQDVTYLYFGLYSSCGNVVVEMLLELVHTWVSQDVRVSPTFNLVCILAVVMLLLCCMSWFTPG